MERGVENALFSNPSQASRMLSLRIEFLKEQENSFYS